ncbi:hypothetical protein AB0L25_17470 [Spirillospora sp. NPDC052242]
MAARAAPAPRPPAVPPAPDERAAGAPDLLGDLDPVLGSELLTDPAHLTEATDGTPR